MPRKCHPNAEIADAIKYAEDNGWQVKLSNGHAWGRIFCPYNDKDCRCGEHCITSIWSTPRNPRDHARKIRKVVDKCSPHNRQEE